MRKLKRGQGTIIKRERQNKNGTLISYLGKCYINKTPFYVTGKSYTECYNKLAQIRKENKPQTTNSRKTLTLNEWLNKWLKTYKEPFITSTTLKNYTSSINNHIPNELLNQPLIKIKPNDLQTIINTTAVKHKRTSRTIYDIFNGAFTQAYNNDLIKNDITKGLLKHSFESNEETPLTKQQQTELINKAQGLFKQVLIGYLWTGCRVSELLTLKWEYYDKDNKTLFINGTKTKQAKRTIPVFSPLQNVLEELPHTTEFIFCISEKTLDRQKKHLIKILNWSFTLKSLRHTFNQNLHDMGITDIVRAAWMGHSKPTTTNKVYTHMTNELKNKAVKAVTEYLDHENE